MKVQITYLFVILVLLGGCLEGLPGLQESGDYDLSMTNVSEQGQDGDLIFRGTVSLSGSLGSGAIVSDVRVTFIDQSGSVMTTVNVGTLSIGTIAESEPRPRENISVRLSEHPDSVVIETGIVQTEEEVHIYGMNRTESGEFNYNLRETKD